MARESSRLCAAVGIAGQTSIDPEVIVNWVGDEVMNHPMISRAVGAESRDEVKTRYAEWRELYREFSPINHVSRDDPPGMVIYSTMGKLPAPDRGSAIHHAMFGLKLKEKADAAGAICVLGIKDQPERTAIEPNEFLLKHLTKP